MTFILLFLFPLISGWIIINSLNTTLNTPTKLGSSYLLGLSLITFISFVLTLIGLKFSIFSTTVPLLIISFILIFFNRANLKTLYIPEIKPLKSEYKVWSWWLIVGIIVYLLVGVYKKGAYWPVTEFDSVCGYDFSAKYLVKEGIYNNTMMQTRNFLNGNRYLYPAFLATADAYAYLCGVENTHIIMAFLFGSFLMAFYGLVRTISHPFIAILGTLFLMVTPEMFAHSTFSLTNLPNAIYSSIGMIALVLYFKSKERSLLLFSALFTASGLWCRTDAIAFFGVSIAMLGLYVILNKKWIDGLIFTIISLLPYVLWNFFTSKILGVQASEGFIKDITVIDYEKLSTIWKYVYDFAIMPHQLYAISFTVFWIFLLINIKYIVKDIFTIVPFFILGLALYSGLFYFIDGTKTGVSIKTYMEMALKRGLFTLVPLSWYFVCTNPVMLLIQDKLEVFKFRD